MRGPLDPLHMLGWLVASVGLLLLFYYWYVRISQKRRERFLREYFSRHPYVDRYQVFCSSKEDY